MMYLTLDPLSPMGQDLLRGELVQVLPNERVFPSPEAAAEYAMHEAIEQRAPWLLGDMVIQVTERGYLSVLEWPEPVQPWQGAHMKVCQFMDVLGWTLSLPK